MVKPKIALTWCASCGGCEESVVDLAEKILEVVEAVDIVFWPVALDFKIEDVEQLPDGSITASLINGAVRVEDHERVAKLLRQKSQIIIAHGACAAWGGIPGLANQWRAEEALRAAYLEKPTVVNEEKVIPAPHSVVDGDELELTEFYPQALPLDKVIEVDYYIPGCPPMHEVNWNALQALLSGDLPPKGSVIGASNRALCYECHLNDTKPEKLLIEGFKRVTEYTPDPEECLLVQGLPCLGPVTRGGCEAQCVKGNMPCTGCLGKLDGVHDYGAKALSYFASILDVEDEDEVKKQMEKIADLVGRFYRYSLPASRLGGKVGR